MAMALVPTASTSGRPQTWCKPRSFGRIPLFSLPLQSSVLHRVGAHRVSRQTVILCSTSTDEAIATACKSVKELAAEFGIQSLGVAPGPSEYQLGLFATKPAKVGEVIARVPLSLCLRCDYSSGGLRLPASGTWPRVKQAVAKDSSLSWDLLLAVALVDCLAGDGGPFWSVYSNDVIPGPGQVTVPLAMPPAVLHQLQHPAVVDAALEQKTRLQAMFPGWSKPMQVDGKPGPTWVQWAFASVRSRAFALGPESFAMLPLFDLANHEHEPAVDVRQSNRQSNRPSATGGNDGGGEHDEDEAMVELVAMRDLKPGDEVTVSYTGPGGYTNQRLMAQYGFVPEGGNPADRLTFNVQGWQQRQQNLAAFAAASSSSIASSAAAAAASETAGPENDALSTSGASSTIGDSGVTVSEFELQGGGGGGGDGGFDEGVLEEDEADEALGLGRGPLPSGLSLAHLQEAVGDRAMMDASAGKNPYLLAALRSLPLLPEGEDLTAAAALAAAEKDALAAGKEEADDARRGEGQGEEAGSNGAGEAGEVEGGTAAGVAADKAREQLRATGRLARRLLSEVEAEFKVYPTTMEKDMQALFMPSYSAEQNRVMHAVLRYRYERKKLLFVAQTILQVYIDKVPKA